MWHFPAELSLKILPLLSLKDIEQCRLVCQQWNQDLDNMVSEPKRWLAVPPVLHHVTIRSCNVIPLEREPGLYALQPIVNVGNDFFIFERKANERFASAVHVVNKCDYEGSVTLTKQTIWLVPYDVLKVDGIFAVYTKPGSIMPKYATQEQREGFFCTVEIFERRTLKPLPHHMALDSVIAMCQEGNVIYHLCLHKDDNSTGGECFKLFALSTLEWRELASTAVKTLCKEIGGEDPESICALNFMACRPYLQVEDSSAMWTCAKHANRLFRVDANEGRVAVMELVGESCSGWSPAPFGCPTVLFGGDILGVRVKAREQYTFVETDLMNLSRGLMIEEIPLAKDLTQICSERFLVYITELFDSSVFLLLCLEKNSYKTRRASFPRSSYGLWNDVRMIVNEQTKELCIHVVSNEVGSSLRSSNHVFAFDLTQEDLNLGLRVFNLGISHYAPAISFTCGLIMQDERLVELENDTLWFSTIKMSSINSSGFVQLSEKHQGKQFCGPDTEPLYLTNCNEGIWTMGDWKSSGANALNLRCKWCSLDFAEHSPYFPTIIPPRMDPAVLMFENMMRHKVYDFNGVYMETDTERIRSRRSVLRGRCRGFLNDNAAELFDYAYYPPCQGDGQTCFHSRWHTK